MSHPASSSSLRARLRDATTEAHAGVDAQLGEMQDARHYRAYLRGMHGFLAAVTPGLAQHAGALGWPPPQWRGALDADLHSVDAAPLEPEAVTVGDRDQAMGLLYVIEGSALGARLLLRRASALGYAPGRGAAYLHASAEVGTRRWPAFLKP